MSIVAPPLEVFYSFAAADEPLRAELDKHLSILRQEKLITTWHTRQASPGEDLSQDLDYHLNTASLILLLISADYLASNYCYGVEMKRAMERHSAYSARVIPILLRPVDDWQRTPFGQLQSLPTNGISITSWSNPDEAFKQVARGIRVALEDLRRLAINMQPAALPAIWDVPYPRNPLFTGREEELQKLAAALMTGQPGALSQLQVISGLPGIGKTQLVIEYTYRFASYYQAVFWTSADTRETLISGYVAIAHRLNLPAQDEQNPLLSVQATIRWLSSHTGWLLILDNADDSSIISEFLPTTFNGRIILTTRSRSTGRLADRIQIDIMSHDIGILFLLRRAAILPANALLAQAAVDDINTAKAIYTELDGLPLALDQAGAYIEETQSNLVNYLQLYRTSRAILLKLRSGRVDSRLVRYHPESVSTTWFLAFKKVEQRSPAAADLLRLCSLLYPDAIPTEIVMAGISNMVFPSANNKEQGNNGWLYRFASFLVGKQSNEPVEDDSFILDGAIAVLSSYSLIIRDTKDNTLSIHRLVQIVLKDSMKVSVRRDWFLRAVRILDIVFPEVEFEMWQQCERYLPHALACVDAIEQENITTPDAASLLNKVGLYLCDRARYLEAEPLYKRALAIREQRLGSRHPETATSLNNLAKLYEDQGRYLEAEPLYKRALAIREQQLGPGHTYTATSLDNLAGLYRAQRAYKEAELLCKRALAIREQQLGSKHPETAASLNNLAGLYYELGIIEEAELLFRRAFAIREQELGPEHPDTAGSLFWLALIHQQRRRYKQARLTYERTLAIYERVLGSRHPNTINLRGHYESLLRAMEGEVDEEG